MGNDSKVVNKPRGISEMIKKILTKMMKRDCDLTPKRAHARITINRKKNNSFDSKYLPTLAKVTN